MGKFGKETKILLLAITTICVISFLLATGISFFLAKGFQQELLLHDYGVSGYQLNHTEKLLISAFTAQPNESDIARGKNALASIGYSSATSMQLLPMVQNYRNQTMWCLFLLLLFSFGTIYFALFLYLNRQHKAIREAEGKIREFLDGNTMSRIECAQAGDWYSLFHSVNEMAAILSAHTRPGGHISVQWARSPLMTQIVISDDGIGIHQEDLYNIFKRFYRSRFSSDVHGVGLGLPLAKSIVEAHGGTISVNSTLGAGTTFTLNFFNLTKE